MKGPNGGGKNTAFTDSRLGVKEAGTFCHKCGAWLGVLGLEPNPKLYVEHMVEVFEEVRRVLAEGSTLWLNLGDCYATGAGKVGECPGGGAQGERWKGNRGTHSADNSGKASYRLERVGPMTQPNRMPIEGLKAKDLVGIPWMVAFALRDAGWWLRSDIVWDKPNGMCESVEDRPTKSHEYLFLLATSERYYYDHEAIKEPAVGQNAHDLTGTGYAAPGQTPQQGNRKDLPGPTYSRHRSSVPGGQDLRSEPSPFRNKRSVWRIPTTPFRGAHFAVFPPKLIEPCILAGCPEGGVVLDPFSGSGTTAMVCKNLGRKFIGCELNPEYLKISRKRIGDQERLF